MALQPDWLKRYYGDSFAELNPDVVAEGNRWAVVKLNRVAERGYRGIGYVLIKKNGSHTSSNYHILGEGVQTAEALQEMKERLERVDIDI
ncbi:MAG: hypothetical protein E6R04_03960 [Spirochaetes bacterium]|jgi:hypothetical protein|nr:MAG: hypothetical protein E6R04_03960 [Spirochaetota bacterium]